jgi:hypothetical protein
MNVVFKFIFLLFVGMSSELYAYIQNRTQADHLVQWPSDVSLIDIFVNGVNSQGISTSSVVTIATNSVNQWDSKSRMGLRTNTTAGSNQINLNELYFSTDPSIFNGTGVVGLTQVFYKNNTGQIVEADILINDSFPFSTDVTKLNFIGNVITHELGHFLGLGHSSVIGSSMFYSLSRGQSQISDDDKSGIYSLYPNGNSTKSKLSGKIVGGSSLIAVFGAHVEAISQKTGKVAGATISDTDGTFVINGLERNDSFFIYTSPLVLMGLPARYNNARFNFCHSSSKYRGSFFQSCGSSSEGFPQAIKLTAAETNIGNITIRCSLDVPIDYIQNKNADPAIFDLQAFTPRGVGNSFVGFFSSQDLSNSTTDRFKIDLSNTDWDAISASGNLKLEVKISNQNFYSAYKATLTVKSGTGTNYASAAYTVEPDGWLNLDTTIRANITRGGTSANVFEIMVKPESMIFPNFPADLTESDQPKSKEDYFPVYSSFEDSMSLYLLTTTIVKDNGDGTFTQVASRIDQMSDNSKCPDANNTYSLTDYSVKRNSTSDSNAVKKSKDGLLACGTVDLDNNSGGGPFGFFVGLILSLILGTLFSTIFKNIRLKLDSKIV